MKKLILAMIFIFSTGTIVNATSSGELLIVNDESIEMAEDMSCLMYAYNKTNESEAGSLGGAYSWDIEKWSAAFQLSFDRCNYYM